MRLGKASGSMMLRIVGCVVLVLLLTTAGNLFNLHPVTPFALFGSGYSSAYQGPSAEFYGVTYYGYQYTASQTYMSSQHQFDSVLHYDVDGNGMGYPSIHGEMTSIFLPTETLSKISAWVPFNWQQSNQYVPNLVNTYSWNISGKMYDMEEYNMRYYVTFSGEWSGSENPAVTVQGETGETVNVYQNLQVWLKINLNNTWYIQGGGTAYFAIAEMRLADASIKQGRDVNKVTYDARTTESVSPEDASALVYLYYSPFGTTAPAGSVAEQYEGKDLNPAYFTKTLYCHLDFNNFGVYAEPVNYFWSTTRGDVATFAFNIRVFVIGEYTVKDIQDNPSQFGRFTPVSNTGDNWLSGIIGWLSNPANITILIMIAAVVLVIAYAPWLIISLLALGGGRRR